MHETNPYHYVVARLNSRTSLRTAAGQRQSFEQPLSHAVACCDKPRGSDRVRSMGQKKVRARKRGRAKTQTIGTCLS